MYKYKYPRPALTTDILLFGFDKDENSLKILLIKRKNEPFKGKWALPGGFVDMDETVENCAKRELMEETCLKVDKLYQLFVASKVDRDPRGRTVSVIFWSIMTIDYQVKAADDADETKWFACNKLPNLAFDHAEIIDSAKKELSFRLDVATNFQEFFSDLKIKNNIEIIKKMLN